MTGQEVALIEDLVGRGFAIGAGDPAEPYVALLRGVDPADVDHQIKMAQSRSYDEGHQHGTAYAESSVKARVAQAVAIAERRVHRDYSRAAKQRRFQYLCIGSILAVMSVALLYLSVQS